MNLTEKRRHSRIETPRIPCTFACIDEKNRVTKQGTCWTLDVSESGLLMEMNFPVDLKQVLLLTVPIGDDIADIKGKVVRCTANGSGKCQVGIEFLEIEWLYAF